MRQLLVLGAALAAAASFAFAQGPGYGYGPGYGPGYGRGMMGYGPGYGPGGGYGPGMMGGGPGAGGALAALNLTDEQREQRTDAAGWTVKDHAIHLSLWENNLIALLEGRSRIEDFDVPQAVWDEGSDAINAVLQPRHRDRAWSDVRQAMTASQRRVLDKVGAIWLLRRLLADELSPETAAPAPVGAEEGAEPASVSGG